MLSRHSLDGHHTSPFIFVCLKCHRKIHQSNNGNWRYSKFNIAMIREYNRKGENLSPKPECVLEDTLLNSCVRRDEDVAGSPSLNESVSLRE
jgi:hypothetical protein